MSLAVPIEPVSRWRLAPGVRLLWRGDGQFHLEHADGGVQVVGLDRELARELARPAREGRIAGRSAAAVLPAAADRAALGRLVELGYLREAGAGTAGPSAGWLDVGSGPLDDVADDAHDETVDESDGEIGGGLDGGIDDEFEGEARVDDGRARADVRLPGGARRLAARRAARVDIVGATVLAAYVGALLGAAGVGRIGFTASGVVRRRHLLPGGLTQADEGRRFAAAAADAVARAAPRTAVAPAEGETPDLTVVCLDAPVEPDLRDLLHHRTAAHVPVLLEAGRAEVGPFVVPGVTSCLRCADLHRLDQDPAWTVLAVQLLSRAEHEPPPDPRLAARAGALVADVVLCWLDDEVSAGRTVGGSWELRPGGLGGRRRSRPPHPECSCRAAWTAS